MNRRTLVLMAIAVLTLTLAASTVAWGNPGDPTDPYANTSCRYCHEDTADRVSATNTVNFHVPAVDYATACKKCHWVQPSSHPYHKSNYKCASCHFGFENGNRAMFPSVVSSSGAYFASAGSVTTTDYALLHTIHGTSRWPTNARATNSKCASCHARAACRVCHAGVIPQTHGDHTWDQVSQSYNSSFTPPATRVCTGTQVGVENQISSAVITETCYMADCHNVSTSTPDAERVEENDGSVAYAPALGADTRYNWVQRSDYRMTNRLDASATLTFYGMKASVIGWKGPLCSAIQVYVDGVSQGTFDNFQSGATVKGQILYTTPTLSKATHTLTLVVRQGVSGSSSHYTMLDYFTVYPALATLKGNCSDPCHVVKLYNHDPNSFDHVSGSGPSVETTVSGGSKNFTCADCHNMQVSSIGGEHGRASSVSSPGALPMDCTTCHPAYADNTSIPLSVNAWNSTTPSRTCYFLACHSPSSPRAAHKQMASDHATPTASNARLCMGRCHASSIATMHANAVKIGDATRTSCKVCHTSNQMPVAGNNCIDCHYVMEGHYYTGSEPTHTITNAEATSTYLGFACNKCHLTQLNPEHQKASSLATTGATPGCTYCHERSWFPTTAWNKTCGACHAGGGKAPASHTATLTKHDYTSSNAFCGGSDCHSVTDASVTHQTPRSDCISSCHTTATVVTTATTCYSGTCHNGNTAYHPTTAAAHVGTQTACITGCHDLYLDTAVGHGGSGLCAKCHANATLTAVTGFVKGSYSNLCTGCHKSGGGGLSSHNYLPVDPNHSTGNDTSHTATGDASTGRIYAGNGDTSGTACTNLCHVTALASEHATVVAQGAGASANGQVTCVECHADNSYNSSVTVHANWTQRRCSNCHDYAAHVTHDTTSTLHNLSADASNTACANTGCHSAITPSGLASDIAALHSSASTSTFTSCNVCHRNDGKVLGIRSGGTVTKCVNCHVDHSATGIPSHDSTSSSDGCSQAGTGCHGVSYANYGAGSSHRWGDMSSLGGGCGGRCHNSYYANIVIATWNSGFNCVTCHKAGAGWVGGHDYTPADPNHSTGNDTSHTATMAYNQYSTVATGGVACNLCHTATMKSVHTTTSVGVVSCNSCHNNTSLGSTGVVKTSWPAKKCTDCHATSHDAYASAHTTATGCTVSGAGCHNSSDVKVLHSNAATGSLTGCRVCHKTADMLVGTLSCSAVGCHTPYLASYTPTDPAHSTGNDTSHTANITAGLYSGVATDGVACNLCHTATMKSVHTTTTVGIVGCASCHNNTSLNSTAVVKTNWTNRLCTACHASSHDTYASSHTTTVAGCTNSGAGCHASTDVKVLHSTATTAGLTGCRVCHKTTDMLVGTLSCSAVGCHTPYRASYTPTDPTHSTGNDTSHTANITAGLYSGVATDGVACNVCHTATMKSVHTTTTVGIVGCASCHNNTSLNSTAVVKTNWTNRLCTACHTSSHDAYASVHTTTVAGCTNSGAGCHASTDVKVLHSTATTQGGTLTGCRVCHKTTDMLVGTLSCSTVGCHQRTVFSPVDPQHYYGTETSHSATGDAATGKIYSGAGDTSGTACTNLCHSTDLRAEHATVVVQGAGASADGVVTCSECHNDTSLNSTVQVKTNWPARTCAVCHDYAAYNTHDTTSTAHNLSADASNTACANTACHSSLIASGLAGDVAALHSTAGTSTFTTCNVCHRNDVKVLGILSGGTVTKCVNCHVDHSASGMPGHVAASAVSSNCAEAGAGCHNSLDNIVVHPWGTGGTLGGGCGGRCHDGTTYSGIKTWTPKMECETCHMAGRVKGHTYTPIDPNHSTGNDTSHTATMAYNQYSTVATGGVACNLCHTATMKSVHTTTSVGIVTCAGCHNNTSLNSTAVVKTSWPAKKCTDCHTTTHAEYASDHTTTVAGCTDAGAGCHNTTDVRVLHSAATTQGGTLTGCRVCHKTADMLVGTLSCSASGCHTPYLASYTPTDPAHSTGNDTSHTANITAGLYSGVATGGVACNLCHTATMKSVHTTTSVGIVTCAGCHNNTSLNSTAVVKTNWTNRLCTACHSSSHDAYASLHTTAIAGCTASGAGCHASTDVKVLHSTATTQGGTLIGCRVCHKTADMLVGTLSCGTVACHQRTVFSPVDPQHYYGTETSHVSLPASMGAYVTTAGATYKKTCADCHFASRGVTTTVDLRSEHATLQTGYTAPNMSCEECHNDTSLNSTAVVKTNWVSRTCGACHGSTSATHTTAANVATATGTRHNFSADASNTACASGGCHTGFTVGNIARGHSLGTTMSAQRTSCNVCHDDADTNLHTVTKCADGRCHLDKVPAHGPSHDGSMALGAQVGILTGQTYKLGKNVGCFGCHFSDLVREHGPAAYIPSINATGAGRSMNGGNGGTDGCGVCHNNKGTPGSYSSNASITAAITNKDHRCTSCHNGASSGTSAAHVPTVSTTVSYLSTGTIWKNPANEFVDGPSRGGHNSMGVWFPKSANLNATTTVWPIPADATFGIGGTTPWVANGYTTTATPVLCSDCHDFGTWLAGPQGANVKITIAQGYSPSQYSSPTASNWTATGNNRIICDKCHPLTTVVNLPAGAHTNHDTRAGAGDTCIDCHIRVPHAWVRPRLLRRTYGGAVGSGAAVKGGAAFGVAADTLPYADPNRLVLVGFQWKADMTTWSAGTDCVTSCGKHLVNVPANGFWP